MLWWPNFIRETLWHNLKGYQLISVYLPVKNFVFHRMLGGQSRRWKTRVVKNAKRQAWYLSKYLSKEDFERYQFSGGWVFLGWIGFSQWIKREFGACPKREMLVELGGMNKVEREEEIWFGLYLWEARKTRGRFVV